jgi:menaquinone-dependent protoporphyrinogen oxidase
MSDFSFSASHRTDACDVAPRGVSHRRGHHVDRRRDSAATRSARRHDAVVLGSRVELGHHAADITAYILAHLEKLEHKPTAFFSVSMAAAKPSAGSDPNGYMRTLFEDMKWKPRCFAARSQAYGVPGTAGSCGSSKRISPSASHVDTTRDRLTDWNRVDRFADDRRARTR